MCRIQCTPGVGPPRSGGGQRARALHLPPPQGLPSAPAPADRRAALSVQAAALARPIGLQRGAGSHAAGLHLGGLLGAGGAGEERDSGGGGFLRFHRRVLRRNRSRP